MAKKEARETQDAINRALKRYGIDPDHSTDLKSSDQKAYTHVAINALGDRADTQDVIDSLDRAKSAYRLTQIAESTIYSRPFLLEKNTNSLKPLEKKFDEFSSAIRALFDHITDLGGILKIIQNKPNCGN